MTVTRELARLGAATVDEAAGRQGLVDAELRQLVPGSRARPARTCAAARTTTSWSTPRWRGCSRARCSCLDARAGAGRAGRRPAATQAQVPRGGDPRRRRGARQRGATAMGLPIWSAGTARAARRRTSSASSTCRSPWAGRRSGPATSSCSTPTARPSSPRRVPTRLAAAQAARPGGRQARAAAGGRAVLRARRLRAVLEGRRSVAAADDRDAVADRQQDRDDAPSAASRALSARDRHVVPVVLQDPRRAACCRRRSAGAGRAGAARPRSRPDSRPCRRRRRRGRTAP